MSNKFRSIITILLSTLLISLSLIGSVLGHEQTEGKEVAGHVVSRTLYGNYDGISVGSIKSIFQSRDGRFWIFADSYDYVPDDISTLLVYDETQNRFEYTGFKSNWSSIGLTLDGRMWVWSMMDEDKSVRVYDGKRWNRSEPLFWPAKRTPGIDIRIIFTGRNGKLWFLHNGMLQSYDGYKWKSYASLPSITGGIGGALEDSEGKVWIGGSTEVFRFDPAKNEWSVIRELPRIRSQLIYEDRKGRIWFVYSRGEMRVYHKETGSSRLLKLRDHLPKNAGEVDSGFIYTYSIYEDKSGRMMFGTDEGLLTFIESENKWELFTRKNSVLPANHVMCILEDQAGRIWLGTGKGIVVLEQ